MKALVNRLEIAKRKVADFYRECREMRREGLAYSVVFTLLLIIASPFLLFEAAVYLLTGRDIGWFPVSENRERPAAQVVTTVAVPRHDGSIKAAGVASRWHEPGRALQDRRNTGPARRFSMPTME